MKTGKPISTEEFLRFVKGSATNWSPAEQTKLGAAITALRPALERLRATFPKKITFVKTTGAEKGHAF
ncbi:MAG: hypothetical protein JO201_03835 [Verrucomicrobia bacterium]|nr:hypothetical protein [Verrucomicrobiota bacterium]